MSATLPKSILKEQRNNSKGLNEDEMKMMSRLNIPKQIYVFNPNDIVKQLSSIGQQTYKTSHVKPHGTLSAAVTID